MSDSNPFFKTIERRPLKEGPFEQNEVRLANRNSGILLEGMRYDVTPVGMHYLLSHFDVPFASEAGWTVEIGGRVKKPAKVSLEAIKAMPSRTLRVTLECSGNGRAGYKQRYVSMPWEYEAVGTAEWTGTPLRNLLEPIGLQDDAVEISFHGADRGFDRGTEHEFGRSLEPEVAMSDDVLLVWAMNGQPLLPQHGYPLRMVVPGWYGMASVKWLDRIDVRDKPYDGYQQAGTYNYRAAVGEPGVRITHMRVKSLLVPPGIPDFYSRKRLAEKGPQTVYGRAWSGGGVPIVRVEFGVDGVWTDAVLDEAKGKYAWRGWSVTWDAQIGEHELACRATDANGEVQPLEAPWDIAGFGNNSVHRVRVTVR